MKVSRLIIAAGIVFAAFFASCEGPAGAAGPQGLQGTTGPNGPQPIISSIVIQDSLWVPSTTVPNEFYCQLTDTSLTDFNDDVVVAYAQGVASPSSDYFALPVSNFLAVNDALSYSYNTGTVTFYYTTTTGTAVIPTVPIYIKVAVIPPALIKQHPGTNLGNYHAVMALLAEVKASNRQ